jgi:threonine dehydrogenase-like Zn-dependent dehydrogenase
MGVSMSTLNTAAAHPPAGVLVTGLGPVGNLAAQIFARCGYAVTAVDPVESRRKTGLDCGLKDVRPDPREACADLEGKIALHVECSGHEQAVVDGCKLVCNRGEVVLVGVPWARRADLQAFDLLHAVFHRYVVLRSGWEWEIPKEPRAFAFNSISGNIAAAMDWLREGSFHVSPLGATYNPADCQKVYAGLLDRSLPTPSAIFDWRL